jgi:excisionase family DNA binding protein
VFDPSEVTDGRGPAVDVREPDDPVESLRGLPLMLTISEAASVLRISRTSAYKLADEWRRSKGASGIPTVKLGSRVLVRRADLARIVGEQLPA